MQKIVGLTGPTGAGKSIIAKLFAENGFYVINADLVAREAVENEQVLSDLIEAFGADIVSDGVLNRKLLAERAFSSKENTEILNSITHPAISKLISAYIDKCGCDFVLLDAPQLFESGEQNRCFKTVAVLADEQLRLERIVLRDKIAPEQAKLRISAQYSDSFFAENCDYVIYNNGDVNELKNKAKDIIESIKGAV